MISCWPSDLRFFSITLVMLWSGLLSAADDLTQWKPLPTTRKPAVVSAEKATIQNNGSWAYLVAPGEHSNAEVSATVSVDSAATQFGFFGSSWSAWPDPAFGDQGFEASLLLQADEKGTRGYPAAEAESLFKSSKIYSIPTLDPSHHYIFADEWPKLTFSQFVPLSQTWIYGRSPFMTGHNQRPGYELVKDCGAGSGFAMKLGPASFGKATLSKSGPLAKGRYVVTALVKSVNTFGPGGRLELEATQARTNKVLATATHFVGNGSFDWKKTGFVFDVPEDAGAMSVAFGNAGTGEMLVTDVEFRRLNDGEAIPAGVATKPNDKAPVLADAPSGAIADFRMLEGKGHHVLNHAGGTHLDLSNLGWVVDENRPALQFADNTTGRKDYRSDSYIGMDIFGNRQDFSYLNNYKNYEKYQTAPFARRAVYGWNKAPYVVANGGHFVQVCVGRLREDLSKVEQWVQVTTDKTDSGGNWNPDLWIGQ